MTSASVGFCSSFRRALSVNVSSGSTLRFRSKRTSTLISHAPLELARVKVVGDERREIRRDVQQERRFVARRAEVQHLDAHQELHGQPVDGVLALAGPSHGRSNDGSSMALHEMKGSLVTLAHLAEDPAQIA